MDGGNARMDPFWFMDRTPTSRSHRPRLMRCGEWPRHHGASRACFGGLEPHASS